MNNKKKQTAVVAMATVLSVTSFSCASPMAVIAQENDPAPPAIMQDENQQKKTAPEIVLPKNLQAMAGTALEEIPLPDHWAWVENNKVITEETAEYSAHFSVDDVTYDYSNVEGYNAEEHYVERLVVITVEPVKPEQEEPVQGKANKLLEDTPTTLNVGDIVIDETNFPDEEFRNWLNAQPYGTDGTIYKTEIAGITEINVSWNINIKDLTGIEHFTDLTRLSCSGTGITKLDVSNNTVLTNLSCYSTGITKLDVSNNTALTSLYCAETGITKLDVSNNTALTSLYCYSTGITKLDVSNNTALTSLSCYGTGITKLDVSNNTVLTSLSCYGTGITKLDVSNNTALTSLSCSGTGITKLDVSNNKVLTSLSCSGTGITKLDVSSNTVLASLYCYGTGITKLDVSNNTALKDLNCSNTGIESLDVSNNTALKDLNCSNTGIESLDVSNNTALRNLNCSNTPLAYLNVGTNNNLGNIIKYDLKPVNVEVTDSFNMADIFAGIDINKISSVKGATYSKGIMSNYSLGASITYTYDCGKSRFSEETIDVTLDLVGKSTISITEDLNKIYDGTAISDRPTISKAGSSSTVSYKWEQKKNNNNWETIALAPTDAGTYRVTATLASDNIYPEATSAPVEFTISQATNSWINDLTITGWTYGDLPNTPMAKAKFRDKINYFYSDSEKGSYTDKVPTAAGTWYVKAIVTETDNYTGMESIKKFKIEKAKDIWIEEPAILDWVFGETANMPTAKAKSGGMVKFTYSSSENGTYTDKVPTTAGTWYVKATVADSNNYTGMESIKKFKIEKAKDTWVEEPAILDWVFGETANTPAAKAKSGGKVNFIYSSSENGTYTDKVPTTAGTWYMKATVADSDNYKRLESIISFTISPKSAENNNQIVTPDINSDMDVENLVIKDGDNELVKGTDYDVEKKQDNNKVTVTITFKGNHVGTVIKTYTVNVDEPKEEPKKTESIQTGDNTQTGLLATMSLLSARCIAFLTGKKRKKSITNN